MTAAVDAVTEAVFAGSVISARIRHIRVMVETPVKILCFNHVPYGIVLRGITLLF
ncbi:MAG: hypothetical protein M8357_13450 [Desulfobulbaceae bacterium]|nr:hypothetical protein [Desulfobulbaceae bacterium]